MSDQIKKNDIVEEGVLDNLLKPLKELKGLLDETDKGVKAFADTIEGKLNFGEKAKELREFASAEKQVNELYKEKRTIQSENLKADNEIAKLKEKLTKLTSEEAKEIAALKAEISAQNRELQANARAVQNQTSTYQSLVKETRDAKNESKELGAQLRELKITGQENSIAYKDLAAQYQESTERAARLDQELKDLDKSVGDNFRNVGNYEGALQELNKTVAAGNMGYRDLRKAIKEYQDIAVQAGRTTPVGRQAIEDAAKLQDELDTLSAQTKALADDGANMKAALQLGEVVASSYQSVMAAQQLLGVESEKVLEVMAKIQAIQVVINNLNKIRNALDKASILSIKAKNIGLKAQNFLLGKQAVVTEGATVATRALNVAMRALPILAIIGAVTAIASAFSKMSKEQEEAKKRAEEYAESQKKLKEEQDKANKAIGEASGEFVGLIMQLRSTNENSEERLRLINEINDTYGLTLQNLADETAFQEQLNVAVSDYIRLQRNKFIQSKNQEEINELLGKQLAIEAKIEKYNKEIDKVFEMRQKRLENVTRGRVARDLNLVKSISDLQKEYEGVNERLLELGVSTIELKQEQDDLTKGGTRYVKQNQTTTKSINNKTKATNDLSDANRRFFEALEADRQRNLQDEEKELQDAANRYDRLIELADAAKQDTTDITTKYENEITDISEKWRNIRENQELEASNRKKKLAIENQILEEEIAFQSAINEAESEEAKEKIRKLFAESRLKLQEEQINTERDILLTNTKLTEEERVKIIAAAELEILKLREKSFENFEKLEDATTDSIKVTAQQISEAVVDIFTQATDNALESLKRVEDGYKRMYGTFEKLAAEGNITAQQSLTEMINQQEEAQRRQMQMEQRKLRMQQAQQVSSILLSQLEQGKSPGEALAAAGAFLATSSTLLASLPSFDVGTENTSGGGRGVDGKGGFLAINHPDERIMTAQQNKKVGDISNPMLADIAYKWRTGQLKDNAGTSYDLMRLEGKLSAIEQAIQNQPQQVVGLEETLSGMVEMMVKNIKGNHTKTTIYKS